jgi:protoporphyrinogen/coproporphyrinogen III oxidase
MAASISSNGRTPGKTALQGRVAIIGGGISGLSAAYYLHQKVEENGRPLEITVLEQAERFGGKVLTEQVESEGEAAPFIVEAGPDSFLTQKPWALQLARELGLEEDLLGTNDAKRFVYVVVGGKPVRMPDGVLLIVPTRFMPFALSPLISPLGKLRMGLDLLIPARRDDGDETLADFIKRRLGSEALDKIAEPLMSGIYNADADRQSIMATFPRFRQIEKDHGSLIRGMLASRRNAPRPQPGSKPVSAFVSLKGGTGELIDALVRSLSDKVALRGGVRVERIEPGSDGGYCIVMSDGDQLNVDAVLLTTPTYITSKLLRPFAAQAADLADTIRYVSTGTLSLAYHESDIKKPLDGFGLVIPSSEKRPINAVTVSSTKFDHRAPQGKVLLRAFFGGSRSPASMDMSDEELLRTVREQLRELLGIEAAPLFHRIYRWYNANPQYDLGHLERVEALEAALPRGLYVTGSAYRGVGMPDCVYQSQLTAACIAKEYTEQVPTL